MRKALVPAALAAALMIGSAGCFVGPPPGPVYGPPGVVEEPPVATFAWGFWPHYEVDHHYVVNNDRVIIHDRHYFPSYGRTKRYIQNDRGEHRGWYRHDGR